MDFKCNIDDADCCQCSSLRIACLLAKKGQITILDHRNCKKDLMIFGSSSYNKCDSYIDYITKWKSSISDENFMVNKIARIEYIFEDESMLRVMIIDDQAKDGSKLIALRSDRVRLSDEKDSTKERIETVKEDGSKIKSKRNWIFRDLCVTIVDQSYRNGQSAVFDEVHDKDKCTCVTVDGRILYELTSAMLRFVGPRRGQLAGVIVSVKSDKDVMAKEINEFRGTATVVVIADEYASDDVKERLQNKKNEMEIDER